MKKWFLDNVLGRFLATFFVTVVVIGGTVVATRMMDTNKEESVPQIAPIGYTLYNASTNTLIDVQPCPHSWSLAPNIYSTDQWMPEFGYKFDFGFWVATSGGILVELKPKGYTPGPECGAAYQ